MISPQQPQDEPEDSSGPSGDGNRLQPISPSVITVWAVIGLIGGWLLRPVGERIFDVAPVVTWAQPLVLFLIAAILGGTAWITHRQVHVRHERLEPYRAVNRLVLGRACTLVGALLAGGYLGYAVSWLGMEGADTLIGQRVIRPAVAALAGVAILVAARLLEHACRVRDEEEDGE